eukprot:COSAG01_NODE_9010_length_2583_cov_3.615539_2_plen_60_part_00
MCGNTTMIVVMVHMVTLRRSPIKINRLNLILRSLLYYTIFTLKFDVNTYLEYSTTLQRD